MYGPTEPRLASPKVKGLRAAVDLGNWSKTNVGVELFPWQAHIARRFLGRTAGKFHYRQALVTCARQNGKTTLFEPLIAWRMTHYADSNGPQVVVLIGSNRRQSIPIFRRVARMFETCFEARVYKVRHGAGTEEVELTDGSIFKLLAASESAGHGLSIDLAIVDEIWDVKEDVVKQGLLPATRARPSPQLLMASTAGTEASTLMQEYRERGLRQIRNDDTDDPFLFAEYSPPEDADRDDPETWAWANPALGRTITREVIEAEYKDPDQSAFDRAVLNRWVRSVNTWLRSGLWAAGEADVTPERAPDVVAVETDRDFRGFGAVSAWVSDEGDACLVRSFATADPKALWAHLEELHEAGVQVLLVPSLFERHPWGADDQSVTRVGSKELERWMPQVTALAEAAAIGHDGDHELAEHVTRAAAVLSSRSGDQTLSAARSPGPIYLARAMCFAVGAATRPKATMPAPVIYVRGNDGHLRGGDLSKPRHIAAVG